MISPSERHTRQARFVIRAMRAEDAAEIAAWRYRPPYDFYDMAADPADLSELLDPRCWGTTFFAVDSAGELSGFFEYRPDGSTLVIGLGLRPDLTGRGLGLDFVGAGLDFARVHFSPETFALEVATFNRRARTVYECAGFEPRDTIMRRLLDRDWEFVRMSRPARDDPASRLEPADRAVKSI